MQPLVLFCVFIAATAVNSCYAISEIMQTVEAKKLECAKDLNLDIEKLMKAQETDELSDEHKKEMGCVHACVMEDMKILEDGKISLDKLKEIHEEVKTQAPNFEGVEFDVMEACANGVADEADRCEIGHKFDECMRHALKEHHIE